MQSSFKTVAETEDFTVVTNYEPLKINRTSYQSEEDLENDFISRLQNAGYEYLHINSEQDLLDNLRLQMEKLNGPIDDDDWDWLLKEKLINANMGIKEKTFLIQKERVVALKRKDGDPRPARNIKIIDDSLFFKNSYQVINQYTQTGKRENRYDVTLLINGLPLVHIELKRRGVPIKEAFNQIERYQRDSFWSNLGLYQFVQIFIISNGTLTKYYSNSTRFLKTNTDLKIRTANPFEFTSFWADKQNKNILSLEDFTVTFLSRQTLFNVLTKYCVLTVDDELLVMRPYQISATEEIINHIKMATNHHLEGTINAGGYIWHTTGSGKTLTSFKTATLASGLDEVDKVIFVVDRKDLDYQTIKEYERFEKGCVSGNKTTNALARQIENEKTKIIITTIQKLAIFVTKNKTHDIYNKKVVFIFDECHRSQFGESHQKIVNAFKKYYLFGFTGTPIFPDNAIKVRKEVKKGVSRGTFATTEQLFGARLHTYTIIDAINDNNVLRFSVDKVKTMTGPQGEDEQVESIDTKSALLAPQRIENNVNYIIKEFNRKTRRNDKAFGFKMITNVKEVATAKKDKEVKENKVLTSTTGFNSILATDSIPMAILYYKYFKKANSDLKVAIIYSFGENEDTLGNDGENPESVEGLDQTSRDFLDNAILDYNQIFHTNYDTSNDKFQNYYKDVSLRMKNKEIDILIVVNMFLTGFDAKTLNTLWVDKNLKYHGLLQAFSRTNRIYNEVKSYGNIVCFRDLEKNIEDSLALFGNKDASGIVFLKSYDSYYNGFDENGKHYDGYKELIDILLTKFPLSNEPQSEQSKKDFINLFNKILVLMNILASFERFEKEQIITDYDVQNYLSWYGNIRDEFKKLNQGKTQVNIVDNVVFETELVKQFEVNIDYILELLKKYKVSKDAEIIPSIKKLISSSTSLRSKKDLIEAFIKNIDAYNNINKAWSEFIQEKAIEELNEIIANNKLKSNKTIEIMEEMFNKDSADVKDSQINEILPPVNIFSRNTVLNQVKDILIEYLIKYSDYVVTIKQENIA